jgi:enamine deaminase RidA (YjgF/YER057c/UK114 family)
MSQAVVSNGMVFLAGQVAGDTSQDVGGQTRQVLAAIDRLLAEAGSDKSRLLSAQIFLADMADFAAMNKVWEAWVVPGQTPARATVQAAMAAPDYRVEIVVTAASA